MPPIKILSWNVNGLRAAARNGFLPWLEQARPDILCLQETRALPLDLDETILRPFGYQSVWHPAKKKGYSGVATYFNTEPVSAKPLGVRKFDDEGRVQLLEYPGFTLINAYFPNSQPERARIRYKLDFCRTITRCCKELRDDGRNVVLCGDYNIAHSEIDLARPQANVNNPGFLPEERRAMTRFLKAGFIDTFRHFCKEPGHYTWWSYRARARERNIGWRLDYHCVNEDLIGRVAEAAILGEVKGSDHCPVSIVLV